jgi:hypothetical protein
MISRKEKCHITYEIMSRIRILNLPEANPILSPGFSCLIHLHTLLEEVKVTKIKGIY